MGLGKALRSSRPLRAAIVVAGVFILLPYALVPLYRFVNPVSTPMVWRWVTGQRVERTFVPLAQIAPTLPLTVILAEDGRYCSHHGVDFQELRGIVEDAEDFDDLRGGSTITQQAVKNLFLWPGRSVVRKILELPLALWVDLVLPKPRIMEIYLNIAEWGPNGQFGADAGSRFAFGKSARQLGPGEAALLAAILPNPKLRSARQPRLDVQRLAGVYRARAARSAWAADCIRARRTR
ncbi:MAG TPA: transglycosylase domain-containing protein [Xanthobacteraceae bacterium]|nr:transglycosylase domain-containing protein [Xanthobacteraceae bacterium]